MSEEEQDQEAATQAGEEPARRFQIHRIYLKDVSFESPATPGLFAAGTDFQPSINFQLNTEQSQIGERLYEVVLGVTVTATHQERTVFLVELKQAGLFEITGFEEEAFNQMVGAYCPAILYPYVRAAVADLVQRGALPPVLLQPINFDAVYARERARQQEGAEAGADPSSETSETAS